MVGLNLGLMHKLASVMVVVKGLGWAVHMKMNTSQC